MSAASAAEENPDVVDAEMLADAIEAGGDPDLESAASVDHLVFILGGLRFAVPTADIEQVATSMPITRVPSTPKDLLGVSLLGGRLVTVADVRRALEAPAASPAPEAQASGGQPAAAIGRWLVLRSGRELIAFGVERVAGITSIRLDGLRPHVADQKAERRAPVCGYVEDAAGPVNVVDVPELLVAVSLLQRDG